jgi:hypothetical protein
MNATTVEKEIIDYLAILSPKEKETVLSVVKTIAKAHTDYENVWDDKDFAEEMNSRVASYENGTAKVFKFEEMKKAAVEAYQTKKATK